MRVKHAVCYAIRDSGRSKHVAKAMAEGFKRHGWTAEIMTGFHSGPKGDLAVGYGWLQRRIFDSYRAAGKPYLYLDMGYWNRKPQNAPRDGHHKVVLNGWCPAATMRRGMPGDRFAKLGIPVVEHAARGADILLAGMSAKSAQDHGFAIEQWERECIARIAAVTGRNVRYRPKPSWDGARPIEGTEYDDVRAPMAISLMLARALVTHHSNAAIDAVAAGVPHHCVSGAAVHLSQPLEAIETMQAKPYAERLQLLNDIAYLQWTPAEMAAGVCFDHYKGAL